MADTREMLIKKLELLESKIGDAAKKTRAAIKKKNNTPVAKVEDYNRAIKNKQKCEAAQNKLVAAGKKLEDQLTKTKA